jgi:hypothetical protein
MNCRQTQQLFDDLARNRLDESTAERVRGHLADCTDCRVGMQKQARLIRLLSLKNHEQPPTAYWDGFLDEFHRRLDADAASESLWRRLVGRFDVAWLTTEVMPHWRPAVLAVFMVTACGVTFWWGIDDDRWSAESTRLINRPQPGTMRLVVDTAPAPLPTLSNPAPSMPGGVIVAVDQPDREHTRYVMDRIAVTPVTYEVANIDF